MFECLLGHTLCGQSLSAIGCILLCYIIYKVLNRNAKVDDIINKCVFITGCDSGFGRALALQLDKQNIPVFAGCLTTEGAKSLREEASQLLRTIQVDVSSSQSIKDAFKFVSDSLNDRDNGMVLWGVVNNAGITGPGGPTEFLTRTEFEKVMQINFFGQVDAINTFLPLLKRSKGRIVNMSSLAGRIPMASNGPYVASKFAVYGYSESLRLEKQPWGISVSTIMPGLFRTGLTNLNDIEKRKIEQWNNLTEEIREEYGEEFNEDVLKRAKEFSESKLLEGKSDLSPVTNSIEHALFSTKPNAVYFVGADAKILSFLEKLPFGLNQFFIGKLNDEFNKTVPKVLQK